MVIIHKPDEESIFMESGTTSQSVPFLSYAKACAKITFGHAIYPFTL